MGISECSSNKIQYHHTENSMMYTDKHKPLTFSLCTRTSNFLVQKEPNGPCFKIPLIRCIFFATSYSFNYKREKYRHKLTAWNYYFKLCPLSEFIQNTMLLKLVVFPSLGKQYTRKWPCWSPQWSNGARITLRTDPTE